MVSILTTWALYTLSLGVAASLLSGFEIRGGLKGSIAVAALFGLLNWALSGLLTLLFTALTLGIAALLSFVTHAFVTALLLKLTDALSDRLKMRSFWTALGAGVIMSLVVSLTRQFVLPLVGLS